MAIENLIPYDNGCVQMCELILFYMYGFVWLFSYPHLVEMSLTGWDITKPILPEEAKIWRKKTQKKNNQVFRNEKGTKKIHEAQVKKVSQHWLKSTFVRMKGALCIKKKKNIKPLLKLYRNESVSVCIFLLSHVICAKKGKQRILCKLRMSLSGRHIISSMVFSFPDFHVYF